MSIINNVTDSVYENLPGINSSSLKKFLVSPKHYKNWLDKQEEEVDNAAFKIGSAVHMACLQPARFVSTHIVAPDVDRRTTAGKALWNNFVAEHQGYVVLTDKEWNEVITIAGAVTANEFFKNQMSGEVFTECSINCEYNGSAIKGRLDLYNKTNNLILDIKTINETPTKKAVIHAINSYDYGIQDYMYKQLVKSLNHNIRLPRFVFMFVEKKSPNSIALFEIGNSNYVKDKVDDGLVRMENCKVTNIWAGLPNENEPIVLE
jgi:exodeoxyribonuclease VIII